MCKAVNKTYFIFIAIFASLKKTVSISLLLIFLSANTELHQFLKLPILIHHFFEHHSQEPDESIAVFLNEHYSNTPDHSDSDHHDHENLPFNSNDCLALHNNIAISLAQNFSIYQPIIVSEKFSIAFNVVIHSSDVFGSIWQPPKIS